MVPSPFLGILLNHYWSALTGVSSAYQLATTEYSRVLTADIQLALASSPHLIIRPLVMPHIGEGLLKVAARNERTT